jgi:hypothetical protein
LLFFRIKSKEVDLMKNKIIAGVVVLLAMSYLGLVSAHQSEEVNENTEFRENYRDMLDIHMQYFNGETTFDEFYEEMESEEFHIDDEDCHGGYGMMGFPLIGMMWR